MGVRDRKRKELFFASHPKCCFCGGNAPATEEDHIPARHLFRDRQWPQGYVFPACSVCNEASSLDELVMGWLVRIRLDDYSQADLKEAVSAIEKLRRRRPEWVAEMQELSEPAKQKLLIDTRRPASTFPKGEVFAMSVPQEFNDAMSRYAEKLGRALFYFHTGKIVPTHGLVRATALTNTEFATPNFPIDAFNFLSSTPALTRSGKSLEDQFAYRYALSDDRSTAAFLVQFQHSVAMTILIVEDRATYTGNHGAEDLTPVSMETSSDPRFDL